MATRDQLSRDQQIELMVGAEDRAAGYLRGWMKDKEFKAALHRHDCADDDNHEKVKRAAGR